ncbi:GNAT family N-acetyltransferase [Exiguobacterium acetylicum]|uniref:lipid II:glycine glycyltransferase FemX n=1 Tax=Exiguobacterium acetylicum TaxID=41170 RepID=UPI0027DEF0A3|nr:GNAT family N-acetyltransferase [Exiguobacterium acetylicum]MDQ6467812.1 GNAT family N-acetyltransferase [Exiguobacterium acetylicum]
MMSLSDERLIRDPREWDALVATYQLDCYYEHAYFELAKEHDEIPELFYYPTEFGTLIYPYLRRPIPGTLFEDITTPYGYGGPFFKGIWSLDQIREARERFERYCNETGIVTETVRFHPLLHNQELGQYWCHQTEILQPTVTLELTDPFEMIESDFSQMTRRNIRKARREGVTIRLGRPEEYGDFARLYQMTMDKHQADARYYFDQTYFDHFADGRIKNVLLLAEHDGRIIAGCIVLTGRQFAHYHLGASDPASLVLRPNHLLFAEMIRWSKQAGFQALHLGGGTTRSNTDSLLAYKRSFSANQTFFGLGTSILDATIYERLTRQFERQHPETQMGHWFPLYRTPIRHLSSRREETS